MKFYSEKSDVTLGWLQEMPQHWELRRARLLFEKKERSVREDDEIVTAFRDGTVTLRRNRRVDGFTFSEQEIGYQGIRRGDLVVHAMDAFAGAIGISDSDGKGSPVYTVLGPKASEVADLRYYSFLLRHLATSGYIQSLSQGIRERSTDFRFKVLRELTLPIPSVEEQRCLADFLDRETAKIDRLIKEKQRLIELIEENRTALITQAVTQGLDPDVEMKDSGVEWLGEIPAHWRAVRLKFLLNDSIAGPFGSSLTKDQYGGDTYRVYGQEQVIANSFDVGDYYIPPEKYKEMRRYAVQPGDVLVSCVGTFGKVAVVPEAGEPGIINPRLLLLRPNALRVVPDFLQVAMTSAYASRQLNGLSRGGTMGVINLSLLGALWLAIPPVEEQEQIAKLVASRKSEMAGLVCAVEEGVERLREYRTALISAAVTGKIDVREEAA